MYNQTTMKKTHFLSFLILNLFFFSCNNMDKKDATQFILKGNIELAKENYEKSLYYYTEAENKLSTIPDIFLNKGIVYTRMGKTELALNELNKAIDLDNKFNEAYFLRAETLIKLGDAKSAEYDMDQIAKAYADSARYYLIRGNLYTLRNKDAQAFADFEKAIMLDSTMAEAYVNRGVLHFHEQKFKDAEVNFLKALQFNPKIQEALNNLGMVYARTKNWDKANLYLDKALQINKVDPLALNNKAYVLLNTGQVEEAKKLLDHSHLLMPENGYTLRNLGLYFLEKNQFSEALQYFKEAIDLEQPVDFLYGYTGLTHQRLNQLTDACRIWRQGEILQDSLATVSIQQFCK